MSEVIIYRSKIEQATDTALFELMSAEWMFPLIVAASVAFLFLMVTEKWFDTMCMKENRNILGVLTLKCMHAAPKSRKNGTGYNTGQRVSLQVLFFTP